MGTANLSWDAMLKMTKVKLELIIDPDMHIFFEKGTRSGISYISNWYSKDNKKYLKSYLNFFQQVDSNVDRSETVWFE